MWCPSETRAHTHARASPLTFSQSLTRPVPTHRSVAVSSQTPRPRPLEIQTARSPIGVSVRRNIQQQHQLIRACLVLLFRERWQSRPLRCQILALSLRGSRQFELRRGGRGYHRECGECGWWELPELVRCDG